MKKTILSALAILVMGASYAQQQEGWCMTDKVIEKQISDDPNFKQVLHNSMMRAAEARNNGLTERATYTIPTVFHIIHDNGVGNISQAQIDDAMRILNEDYRRENADTSDTRNNALAPFVDYAGSMDVEFILAKLDPNGNCTNGVVRVNAPNLTYNAGESCKSSYESSCTKSPKLLSCLSWPLMPFSFIKASSDSFRCSGKDKVSTSSAVSCSA